ncbi:aromatic ring-hydroxylating oxygenase subunit alpha [Solimicrobium silvestre]|uniref:Phenylpropionate dioxygenase and related ring-hydroxylating dioxygenases large terminal subunit n=1 Tax=Solimicrobium silvestre TaxID=2099400 RepID=A0A2S9GW88_9BURK|nr:aromatic ring-hydroxylating dioxygenase subunit alpha [Solimicrobium silvestre]PRC91989.1 Phenylpropionate dioxygenase and related ring-hydroxylating dioxygenases large terminal subunit [Solimicrobium silvestre]
MSTPASPLRTLLDRRKSGYSLEAPFYTDPAIFEQDIKHIFGQHWIYVGPEVMVPEEGDFVTIEIGRTSVLIVRSDDMQVNAFHNVCRHRGSRLCTEHKGSVGNLVCPYHQWTYNLEGTLLFAEHMGESFNRSGHNLKPVHVRNIAGLIFICLAENPPKDIEDLAAAMTPYIAPHRISDCKIATQIDIIEDCNWKLTMENNRECYHCRGNHPELTISLYEYGFGYAPTPENCEGIDQYNQILEQRHQQWEAMGLPCRELDHLDDCITGFRTQRLPLDRAGQSQTMNAKVASSKLLADFQQADLGALSFWTQPNSWHHFMSDHIVTFTVLPISAEKTMVRTTWLVHKDAVEGRDYNLKDLTAVWVATNAQDRALVERSQQGIRSDAYEPGPYSPFTEMLVEKFCNWYTNRLSALAE